MRAAAEIRERLAALGDELGGRAAFRTGVNTGEVVAGEGETFVTGDAVNVAARLEQAAAPGEILIGEETLALVRDAVRSSRSSRSTLKGKCEPVARVSARRGRRDGGAFARHLDAPLVGRERELQRSRRLRGRPCRERACHLFTLLGPAGVGKSRLVAEFLAIAGGRPTSSAAAACPTARGSPSGRSSRSCSAIGVEPERA